jgi:hypothetical protein
MQRVLLKKKKRSRETTVDISEDLNPPDVEWYLGS